MTGVVTEIISILVAGLSEMATGIGSGLTALATSIFLDSTGDTTKLSVFGGLVCVFGGISLAVGLSRWVVNWVSSLGN